jgi:hypothetical protein
MKAFCGKGIVGLGGGGLINAGVEFRARSRSSDSELVWKRERDRQSCLFKEARIVTHGGKHFNATRMLISGSTEGLLFPTSCCTVTQHCSKGLRLCCS